MESAGYLVSSTAEFTTGVELRVDYFHRRNAHLRVDIDWHSAPVVRHDDGVVRLDADCDVFTITCQRFVYRVVYYLIYEMVESRRACTSDVHTRS